MEENTLKEILQKLGLSKKQGSEIDTSELKVKENIIYYSDGDSHETALQISSISQINAGPAPKEKVPGIVWGLLIVGLIIMSFNLVVGFLFCACAVGIIYFLIQINKKAGDDLTIFLNSGRYYIFNFKNKAFMEKVFLTLIDCINHKVSGEMTINISNSTIQSSTIGKDNIVNY